MEGKYTKTIREGDKTLSFANNNTDVDRIELQRYDYIPVDFIKCDVIGFDNDYFKQNMNLTLFDTNKENKQIQEYYVYQNMKIIFYPESKTNRIVLEGSLHKFINDGLHNYDQFTEQRYYDSIKKLYEIFGLSPENLYIQQLEYGVNITPPIETKSILHNLLQHKGVDFKSIHSDRRGDYYQANHRKNYVVKVYDKASQFGIPEQLIRIEVKQIHWAKYRKSKEIETLEDFNKSDKKIFVDDLLNKWDKIIFYDPTNQNIDKWNKYSHTNFWREMVGKSRTTRKRHRDRLKKLNREHGLNVQELTKCEILNNIISLQGVTNYNFSTKRRCKLTGVDISMQKDDSFLLSHTGLYFLLEHAPTKYDELKRIFLSENWVNAPIKTQVKEIAHNIRTRYNYRDKKERSGQLNFFGHGVTNYNFMYSRRT